MPRCRLAGFNHIPQPQLARPNPAGFSLPAPSPPEAPHRACLRLSGTSTTPNTRTRPAGFKIGHAARAYLATPAPPFDLSPCWQPLLTRKTVLICCVTG